MAAEFDPAKDAINRRKHGLMLELGAEVFDRPFIEEEDRRADYGETRFVAIGPRASLNDRLLRGRIYLARNRSPIDQLQEGQ